MIKKKRSGTNAIFMLMIVFSLSAVLILTISSCSGSRKSAGTQKEIPPPPPPPPPVQANQEVPAEIFTVVEEMPEFPGGDDALMNFIMSNIKYPEQAKMKKIQGQVIVKFCVKYDGKIGQIMIQKGVDPTLDDEAIRVIKLMPVWQPGKQGGKPVNVWYYLPVTFNLK